MRMPSLRTALLIALVFVASVGRAQAAVILITNAGGLTPDGVIDWGVLGPSGTSVPSPFSIPVPGIPGLDVTVSGATGPLERLDQGAGFSGNFAPGEELLYTGNLVGPAGGSGPITFLFDADISGFGSQIMANFFGAFTAQIEAFDFGGNSLGAVQHSGTANSAGDDSAIFIGILSDSSDIRRIVVSLTAAAQGQVTDFAINGPIVQATAVPEPASMLLVGAGLLGAVRRSRRRSKR